MGFAAKVYFETGPQLLFVPFGLILCLAFSGLSMILTPINYRKRDVRLVVKYMLQFWLYVTPVLYSLQYLHGFLLTAAKLNPLAPMMEMINFGLIGGGNVGVRFVLWGSGAAATADAVGLLVITRYGPIALSRPLIDDAKEGDVDDDDDVAIA